MVRRIGTVAALLLMLLAAAPAAAAEPIGDPAFQRLWDRTGVPIQRGAASYSWVWGPAPFTPPLGEAFAEGQGGRRTVQYFDKSRMEINDPNGNASSPWFVTNGLLVNELIEGQVQTGLSDFIPLAPANIPLAGDPGNTFPTYASLIRIYRTPLGRALGSHVTSEFLPEGANDLPQYANTPATEITHIERSFGIPRAFWDFLNARGTVFENNRLVGNQLIFDWLFTVGYPTTDAFWARVRIGGVERDVMFQAFERRVLTYVPTNPAQFQVEMGNVGQHYYQWRYVQPFSGGKSVLITVPEAGATVFSPLVVRGFENGTAFEAAITVRLRAKASGAVLATDHIQVVRPDIGLAGPFTASLTFTPPAAATPATIEVLTFSARDGSEIPLASQEVVLGKP